MRLLPTIVMIILAALPATASPTVKHRHTAQRRPAHHHTQRRKSADSPKPFGQSASQADPQETLSVTASFSQTAPMPPDAPNQSSLNRQVQDYNALLRQAQNDMRNSDQALKMSNDYAAMRSRDESRYDVDGAERDGTASLQALRQNATYTSQMHDHLFRALDLYRLIRANPQFAQSYQETEQCVDYNHIVDKSALMPEMRQRMTDAESLRFITAR